MLFSFFAKALLHTLWMDQKLLKKVVSLHMKMMGKAG